MAQPGHHPDAMSLCASVPLVNCYLARLFVADSAISYGIVADAATTRLCIALMASNLPHLIDLQEHLMARLLQMDAT